MSRERLLALIGSTILRCLLATVRVRLEDRAGLLEGRFNGPVLISFWHNRILAITSAFQRYYPHQSRKGVTVLTSASRDGEILSEFVAAFGMGSVRGSSSRRGSRALLELVRLVRTGRDIAITPDGPRGPKYTLGPGAIQLAASTGAPLVLVHAKFSRAWRMRTWDAFTIPLPFSTISVTVDPPIHIGSGIDDETFEFERRRIEEILRNAAD